MVLKALDGTGLSNFKRGLQIEREDRVGESFILFRPNVLDGREGSENWDMFSRRDGVFKFSGAIVFDWKGCMGEVIS